MTKITLAMYYTQEIRMLYACFIGQCDRHQISQYIKGFIIAVVFHLHLKPKVVGIHRLRFSSGHRLQHGAGLCPKVGVWTESRLMEGWRNILPFYFCWRYGQVLGTCRKFPFILCRVRVEACLVYNDYGSGA